MILPNPQKSKALAIILSRTFLHDDSHVTTVARSQRKDARKMLCCPPGSAQPKPWPTFRPPSVVNNKEANFRIGPCFSSEKEACKIAPLPAVCGDHVLPPSCVIRNKPAGARCIAKLLVHEVDVEHYGASCFEQLHLSMSPRHRLIPLFSQRCHIPRGKSHCLSRSTRERKGLWPAIAARCCLGREQRKQRTA